MKTPKLFTQAFTLMITLVFWTGAWAGDKPFNLDTDLEDGLNKFSKALDAISKIEEISPEDKLILLDGLLSAHDIISALSKREVELEEKYEALLIEYNKSLALCSKLGTENIELRKAEIKASERNLADLKKRGPEKSK